MINFAGVLGHIEKAFSGLLYTEVRGKLRGADIEILQNPLYKRVQGKAEAVLERHLKKTHHLRHLNNVGGQYVRAPDLDPKWGPIPGRKDLTIQGPTTSAFYIVALKYSELLGYRILFILPLPLSKEKGGSPGVAR